MPKIKLKRQVALIYLTSLPRTALGTFAFGILWEDIHKRQISWADQDFLQKTYFTYLRQELSDDHHGTNDRIRKIMEDTNLPLPPD